MAPRGQRPELIAIVGPTASGKSDLAMRVAKEFNGEIIAADSRTIYKEMDIGTAKPTDKDRQEVPHHLIDLISPQEKFSVGKFKKLADDMIADIKRRNNIPILVGGTGLYLDSVLYNYRFSPNGELDPINPRHRAKNSKPKDKELLPRTLLIGIMPKKGLLEHRIAERIRKMIKEGFIGEVRTLATKYGDQEVFKTPGYSPFLEYINGVISLEEAKEEFIKGDIKLAKKQKTWFKRNPHIHWFSDTDSAYDFIKEHLSK